MTLTFLKNVILFVPCINVKSLILCFSGVSFFFFFPVFLHDYILVSHSGVKYHVVDIWPSSRVLSEGRSMSLADG